MDNDLVSPPPPSPPMSVNQNQLAMSLLNNLLQMQGLENTILNQQQTTSTPPSTSSSSPSSAQASYNPQLLLEQQIKLTQLQQLQQLQNQIFQQQVLLPSCPFFFVLPFTYFSYSDRPYQWSISSYICRRLYKTSEQSI